MFKTAIIAALVAACASPSLAAPRRSVEHLTAHTPLCSEISDIVGIVRYMKTDPETFRKAVQDYVQRGNCIMLPEGTQVRVEQENDIFACIRVAKMRRCGWTILPARLVR